MDERDRRKRERAHENLEAEWHHREKAAGLVVGAGSRYFQLVKNLYDGTPALQAAAREQLWPKWK